MFILIFSPSTDRFTQISSDCQIKLISIHARFRKLTVDIDRYDQSKNKSLPRKAQNVLFKASTSVHETTFQSPLLLCVCSLPAVTAVMGSVVQKEQ